MELDTKNFETTYSMSNETIQSVDAENDATINSEFFQ